MSWCEKFRFSIKPNEKKTKISPPEEDAKEIRKYSVWKFYIQANLSFEQIYREIIHGFDSQADGATVYQFVELATCGLSAMKFTCHLDAWDK